MGQAIPAKYLALFACMSRAAAGPERDTARFLQHLKVCQRSEWKQLGVIFGLGHGANLPIRRATYKQVLEGDLVMPIGSNDHLRSTPPTYLSSLVCRGLAMLGL